MRCRHRHSGSALLVVMVFMGVFSAVAAGYLVAANSSLDSARLHADNRRAQVAAESGLAFLRCTLPDIDVSGESDAMGTLQAIADQYNARFRDTLFGGAMAEVEDDGDNVLLPAVVLDFPEGQAQFRLRIVALSDDAYSGQSVGAYSRCDKSVTMGFVAGQDRSMLAAFGIASKSRIVMTGNPSIRGGDDPEDGSILSTTYSATTAIDLTGNIDVSGDVSVANPEGEVSLQGNVQIDGDIRIGVDQPKFPEIETAVFEQYAINEVGPGTPTSGNRYFENIRILADTNPIFGGNITMRGIVYIESPNRITFTGNLDLVGAVVVEPPPGALDLDDHCIHFTGNTSTNGTSALPVDAHQFDGLRDLTGSFVLAPGYEVEFTGNFRTINGSIAASRFKFTGNASGTIVGSILNLDDTDFVMTGNSRLTIDHNGMDDDPAGMTFPRTMSYVPGTYSE